MIVFKQTPELLKQSKIDNPSINVENIKEFRNMDLSDICDATEATMHNNGFSIGSCWEPPERDMLESYFKGVLLVPERVLFAGRYESTIAGSIQLVKPSPTNQTSSFACSVDNHFVAPWARGHGMAKMLLDAAEAEARRCGFTLLKLSVRANRDAAIHLYETMGYTKWGTLDKYEKMGDEIVPGYFYCKDL